MDTNYKNYCIDAADIWEYECECYLQGEKGDEDKDSMRELYKDLQQFYLLAKHESFIQSSDDSPYAEGYRKKYIERTDEDVCFTFFICAGKVYSMRKPCEVFLKSYNHLEFQRLFILKLRQYHAGLLHVENFLKYQLKTNFKNNVARFRKFLKLSLIQYPDNIDSRIINAVDNWFLELDKKKERNVQKPKRGKGKSIVLNEEVKAEVQNANVINHFTEEVVKNDKEGGVGPPNESQKGDSIDPSEFNTPKDPVLPEGYVVVPGKFTQKEMLHFFSFLYNEKSLEDKPFLLENEVNEMFKYGLAIPPTLPLIRYKLNYSPKFPKNIVEFCIYKFFSAHTTSNAQKKAVLTFFANYIADFNKALINKNTMQTWADNVRGKRPRKMNFIIGKYLPTSLR